jgi:hypothetical protein
MLIIDRGFWRVHHLGCATVSQDLLSAARLVISSVSPNLTLYTFSILENFHVNLRRKSILRSYAG